MVLLSESSATREKNPRHKDMKIKFTLDPPEGKQVFQIYLDLTKDDLLVKCMMGKTQNPNPSTQKSGVTYIR